MKNHIRTLLARRRLEKLMKPDPAYRERRLAHLSPERRERYLRNMEILGRNA